MVTIKQKLKQQREGRIYTAVNLYKHPGFPKISAINALKTNTTKTTEQKVNMAAKDIELMSNQYEGEKGAALRKESNNLFKSRKEQPMAGFAAYFNTRDMKSGIEAINKVIREKMHLEMIRGSNDGVSQTASDIRTMTREFKSKYLPNRAVEGDLYHTIADSLEAHDMQVGRQQNQFISLRVGSYDVGDDRKNPTGVRGSRMDKGTPSLIELTERGTGTLSRTTSPKAGTKRIKRLLKGKNVAGVTRKR
tara:strand:+ start:20 stop:766 length:747 start_codon:yes stop_codon:yes gene_type:complete